MLDRVSRLCRSRFAPLSIAFRAGVDRGRAWQQMQVEGRGGLDEERREHLDPRHGADELGVVRELGHIVRGGRSRAGELEWSLGEFANDFAGCFSREGFNTG